MVLFMNNTNNDLLNIDNNLNITSQETTLGTSNNVHLETETSQMINYTSNNVRLIDNTNTISDKTEDGTLIKNLFPELELSEQDVKFLSNYLEEWLVDGELSVNKETIEMLNKHEDNINKLKSIFAKNKIMDITERKITLSKIANGELTITRWKNSKDGPFPIEEEPSFNERITAINALTALDAIDNNNNQDKQIIIDDIHINMNCNE